MNAISARIPSIEEWYDIVSRVKGIKVSNIGVKRSDFMLRDSGKYSERVACVDRNGDVVEDGVNINDTVNGIRPIITVDEPGYPGCKATIKNLLNVYTYVSEFEVFPDNIVGRHRFGNDNNYENSELKEYINSLEFLKTL